MTACCFSWSFLSCCVLFVCYFQPEQHIMDLVEAFDGIPYKKETCLGSFQSGKKAASGCTTTLMWLHGKGVVRVQLPAE